MEQENIRFQIEQKPDQVLTKEGCAVNMWYSWQAWANVAIAVLLLAIGGYFLFNAAVWAPRGYGSLWKENLPIIVWSLGFGVLFLVRLFMFPGSYARKYIKRLTVLYGDPAALAITYFFGDDGIHSELSNGAAVDTAYDQILSVHETAHGIILRRKMHMFDSLDKSKIQGGTLPDFRAFLQEKMPKAEFHWKQDTK